MSSFAGRNRRGSGKNTGLKAGLVFAVIGGIILFFVVAAAFAGVATLSTWLDDLPDYESAEAFNVMEPTSIYSSDGKLLAKMYLQNREMITYDRMGDNILNAIVAVEDERYFEHNGVDVQGIVRAALTGYGGASTIDQQLIRQTVLIKEANERSIKRKVREAYLATELEKKYSKEDILSMYLNSVYFGDGVYGIEAASKNYFGKSTSKLTVAQAALLAGIPQRPTAHNPYANPVDSVKRRDHVLGRMLENKYITQAEYDKALATKLKLKKSKAPDDGVYAADYFVAAAKKELQKMFGEGMVFGGGMKVITTIDMKKQKSAEKAVKNALPKGGPSGALVSIEPKTGHVVAMVGGKNFNKNKFNLATQAVRQPGSSFKTFVLAAAIKDGMSPEMYIDGSSPARIKLPDGKTWEVSNSEGASRGTITLRSATAASVNTVYARVAHEIGADKVVKMAKVAGITSPLKAYDSIALGAQTVTVFDMASAYATLANDGVYNKPVMISKITDRNGKEIYKAKKASKRRISSDVNYAVVQCLRGVVTGGTATRAGFGGRPVAGKTGTSQKNRDVWFCGFTPELSTAVWVGYPKEQTIYINGSKAFGGTVCAPIFRTFMSAALAGRPITQFKTAGRPEYNNSKYKIQGDAADSEEARKKKEEEAKKKAEEEAKRKAEEEKKKKPKPSKDTTKTSN